MVFTVGYYRVWLIVLLEVVVDIGFADCSRAGSQSGNQLQTMQSRDCTI